MTYRRMAAALLFSFILLGMGKVFPQTPTPEQKRQYPDYPSETPDNFKPTNYGFEYDRRDVMIAMRDGVKLHTVILVPNGAKSAPILMTRTPYNATALT